MNDLSAKIYYGQAGSRYALKIIGGLRFSQCGGLEYFLKDYLPANLPHSLVVDLSEATLLDSTALGLLAQIALQFQQLAGEKPSIYCPNADLRRILLSMSLDQLFEFTDVSPDLPALQLGVSLPESEREQTERVLEAHETLMDLSKENKKEFQSLVDLLQESLLKK